MPAILSVAGLLMGANSAFAQRGGHGGSHGGGGHSSGHGGGAHYSGGHISGGHSYGGHYYGGHGGGYYGGGYYPGIFGGSYPWYDSYYPRYSYYDAPAIEYYPPSANYYVRPAPVVVDYANIEVIVPDPQARVWFDGNGTSQMGTDRLFNTPSLAMGSTYSYQIRASWMQGGKEVSQKRTVSVTPGQTTVVNFTR